MSSMESIQGSELWFKALGVAAAAVLNKKGCVMKLCFLLIKKGMFGRGRHHNYTSEVFHGSRINA